MRKDAGYPPLVTPSSQIVGTQAVFNVLMGRYKVLTGEFADLMLGYYGETIGRRDRKLIEQASKHAKKAPISGRPADLLKPEWEELRTAALALKGCNGSDEDVLTYAMFPQVAPKFFANAQPRVPRTWARTPPRSPPRRRFPPRPPPKARRPMGKGRFVRPSPTRSNSTAKTHQVTVAPE